MHQLKPRGEEASLHLIVFPSMAFFNTLSAVAYRLMYAIKITTPFLTLASSIASASASVCAMGFSSSTCLPALAHAIVSRAWS